MNVQKITIPIDFYNIQADLYDQISQDADLILMAHGLGGEKSCQLDHFAKFYHELGYRVCVFDHRGFGESTGKVRYLVDKNSQLKDWETVIQYLNQNLKIPTSQMILWGYSFSGGHVLTLAAQQNFKAIISNFPHVDGLASLTLYPKKYLLGATLCAMQDLALARIGKVKTMPVVAKDRFAILAGEDCYEGYHSIIPDDVQWDNAVPARIVATIGLYRPTATAHHIQSPTFVLGATQDSLIPIKATRKLEKKLKYGQYLELNCGHFDLFHHPFQDQILQAHKAFLATLP